MASGKQSPRQKMINMMYLVLTALLAMNVSKDILNSFVTIDEGQNINRRAFEGKLAGQMGKFATLASEKPDKYQKDYERAQAVHKNAKAIVSHISMMKAKTIALTEGKTMEEVYDAKADTVLSLSYVDGKDNYDVNTRVLYGLEVKPSTEPQTGDENPEGYNYRAAELRRMLTEFRDGIVADFEDQPALVQSTKAMFNFEGNVEEDGTPVSWESVNFYHLPLAATTSILSKIQSDVLSVESDAVGKIFSDVEGSSMKFTQLAEAVIPEATYVTQGGKFNAEVFLAAYDDSNPPEIRLGNPGVRYDSTKQDLTGDFTLLEQNGAKGKVEIPANGLGPQHREGMIIFKPAGLPERRVGFNLDYTVAAPSLVVSPTKMNVFYRGLSNPVSISVAGMKDSDLSPSMTNGSLKRGANGWEVSGLGKGKEAVVSCSAKLPDGSSKNVGSIAFRVKNVPDPVAFFGGKSAGDSNIGKGELRAAQGVAARLENFEFEGVKFKVTQFKLTMIIKGQPIEKISKGAYLTPDMKAMIGKASSGQRVFIENIRAVGPDGSPRKLGAISLKIN